MAHIYRLRHTLKTFFLKNKDKRKDTWFTPKSLNPGKLPPEVGFVRVHTPPLGSLSPPTRANRLQEAGCPHAPPLRLGRPGGSPEEASEVSQVQVSRKPLLLGPGPFDPSHPAPPAQATPHQDHTHTARPQHPLREASLRAQATGARGPRTLRPAPAGSDQSESGKPTWAASLDAHCSVCGRAVNHRVPA